MKKLICLDAKICITVLLLVTIGANAEEAPSNGLLYNTKESHSLVYRCKQTQKNLLDCDFVQTAVRKKAKPEDLKVSLNQAREEFRSGRKVSAQECKSLNDLIDILEGRKRPPKGLDFNEITEVQKRDSLKEIKTIVAFCKAQTEESYLNIARVRYEKATRTCKVSANTFKQKFRFVEDTGAWVVEDAPEGSCGIVQLSRFDPERLQNNSKLVIWKYVARKAVTNPQGTLLPDLSCKGLDEGEYVYDWRTKEHNLGCEYVEFSPV